MDTGAVPEQPARHGHLVVLEGVAAVDQQCRRSVHAPAGGVSRAAHLAFSNGGVDRHVNERGVEVAASESSVGATTHEQEVDVHGR